MNLIAIAMSLLISAIMLLVGGALTDGFWSCGATDGSELTPDGYMACSSVKTLLISLPPFMIVISFVILASGLIIKEPPDLDIARSEVWQEE